jgi:hypothetical protein
VTVYVCYLCMCRNYLLSWTKICLAFRISFIFSACRAHVVIISIVVVIVIIIIIVIVIVIVIVAVIVVVIVFVVVVVVVDGYDDARA